MKTYAEDLPQRIAAAGQEDLCDDFCDECTQVNPAPVRYITDAVGDGVYVEWSTSETVENPGCVGITFCSWDCAARWFQI